MTDTMPPMPEPAQTHMKDGGVLLPLLTGPLFTADQMRAYGQQCAAAERERMALTDDAIERAYNETWRSLPSDFGHTLGDWFAAGARYVASLADPQRLHGKRE